MSTKNLFIGKAILCAGLLLATADRAVAVTLQIKAVRINDSPITPSAHVSVQPGDRIVAEFYIGGWNVDLAGSELCTFEVDLDRMSWVSGSRGTVLPNGWDAPVELQACETQLECVVDGYQLCDYSYCTSSCSAGCPPEFPLCQDPYYLCHGPDHDPEGANAFIDTTRPDYVHFGFSPLTAFNIQSVAYRFGGVCVSLHGPLDPGVLRYVGTLTLKASSDACGKFSVATIPEYCPDEGCEGTMVNLCDGMGRIYIRIMQATPLTIRVSCAQSACCTSRNPCENTSQADCATRGGTWQEGKFCGEGDQTCPRIARPRESGSSR